MKNKYKTLLILDLDETLVHACQEKLAYEADFALFDYHVYIRPHLSHFLEQIRDSFTVAVWSSASDDYVVQVVKHIFPEDFELAFVWGRSRCTYKGNIQIDEYGYYSDDYMNHYFYIKRLQKLKRKGYQMERILIVDDTPRKSRQNYGNAIYPSEYNGDPTDDELIFLSKYLLTLKDEINVRTIEKRGWRNSVE